MGLRAFTKDILIPKRAVRLGALHGEHLQSVQSLSAFGDYTGSISKFSFQTVQYAWAQYTGSENQREVECESGNEKFLA